MYLKNLQAIFLFITFALLTLSSPINNGDNIANEDSIELIHSTNKTKLITDDLSIMEYKDFFPLINLLSHDLGSNNDNEIINYILNGPENNNTSDFDIQLDGKSDSAFIVPNKEGNGYYFGRNFHSTKSNNLIMVSHPEYGYSSISTVNTDFIKHALNKDIPEDTLKSLALLVPLDGVNEKGVSISVNVVPYIPKDGDSGYETIDQNAQYIFNISSAVLARVVLDNSDDADEAIDLIRTFNIHSSQGVNVHYMIADASGKSYVVEYIHNELVVTKSSIATNFYAAEGEYHKFGSGLDKYDTINEMIIQTPRMSIEDVKNTLRAAKDEETQYGVVYDLSNREAIYYPKGNYEHGYKIKLDFIPEAEEQNPLDDKDFKTVEVDVTEDIIELRKDLLVTEFRGDDGLNDILKLGGVKNDGDITKFLSSRIDINYLNKNLTITPESIKACSAFSVKNENDDGYYFGRNYDWKDGTSMVIVNRPSNNDYASISTVDSSLINMFLKGMNTDEVLETIRTGGKMENQASLEIIKTISILYPFDGINEKGLSLSSNMVPGEWTVNQNIEGKDHFNTGIFNRLILNKAATVDEAIELIKNYNMHFSLNLLIHFTISDASGKTVVVEYSEDGMFVTETKVVTNHYLSDNSLKQYNYDVLGGDRRYQTLLNRITKKPNQNLKDVRNTLRSAEQDITIWSIAFDQMKKEATYFIGKNFDVGYRFKLITDNKYQDEVETETLYSSSEEEDMDDTDTSDITIVDEE